MLAEHKNSGINVAVKIISKAKIEKTFSKNGIEFMESELCEKLTQENCENLLRTLETFEDNEYYYIVTEFMQAGDLFKYICKQPDQPLDEEHAKSVIKQIATGLSVLHSKHIVHRDIKIENILVTSFSRNSTFKLADFGSATQFASASDKADFQVGTHGYLAPEVLKGEDYNCAVDIYSLGAVLHVLLSAKLPFWDEDRSEMRRKVKQEALDLEQDPYTANLSENAKDLLRGMLAKDAAQRFTVKQILAHKWLN